MFGIAEQLRELALFGQDQHSNAYLEIAESLHQIAERQRTLRLAADEIELLAAWKIRKVLSLRFRKSAVLLHYLSNRPDRLFHYDVLLAKLDTTSNSLKTYAADVRGALERAGLRGEFLTVSRQGYLVTTTLVERMTELCAAPDSAGSSYQKAILPLSVEDQRSGPYGIENADIAEPLNVYSLRLEQTSQEVAFAFSNTKSVKIIFLLAACSGAYISTEDLASQIKSSKESLKVLIHRIRKTFASLGYPNAILNARGRGYSMPKDAAEHALFSLGPLVGKARNEAQMTSQI